MHCKARCLIEMIPHFIKTPCFFSLSKNLCSFAVAPPGEKLERHTIRDINDSFDDTFQNDASGHRILQEPVGSCGKNHRILKEKNEKSLEDGSSIPSSGNFRIFSGDFWPFPSGNGRKLSKKIRKFPGRNTTSMKSPEVIGTGRFLAGFSDLEYDT